MKLSTKSEYSLLILIYLARCHSNAEYVALDVICTHYDIPVKYAEQLVGVLKQNRLVSSRRGSSGGYRLARSPEAITMADVVRLMDGALAPTAAVSEYFFNHTPIEKEDKVLGVLRGIRDYISETMERTTLAALM
jgi:Rrf2 family cysteine metabolism transcriptional repressor